MRILYTSKDVLSEMNGADGGVNYENSFRKQSDIHEYRQDSTIINSLLILFLLYSVLSVAGLLFHFMYLF